MSKALFVKQTVRAAFQLGGIFRETSDLIDVYLDRGYDAADPITDADINEPVPGFEVFDPPLTVDDFNKIAGLLVELNGFFNNQPVETKDRGQLINIYRTDV